MRICVFSMLAMACTGTGSGDDWQPVTYVDEGELCFEQRDSDVAIRVDPQECLSSSCSRAFEGSCTASLQDNTITVSSDIAWEENVGNVSCTDDCGSTAVECTLPALADGTYTVIFGDQQIELQVPITEPCQP
jgi:hypothetical protein